MADADNPPNSSPAAPTEPIIPVQRDDSDTALERAVDFDDDHLPRDTAPLDRADLDALRELADGDAELGGRTDELGVADFDDDTGDDTLTDDTLASEAVPEHD